MSDFPVSAQLVELVHLLLSACSGELIPVKSSGLVFPSALGEQTPQPGDSMNASLFISLRLLLLPVPDALPR